MKQSKPKKYKALMSDVDGTLIPNNSDHNSPNKRVKKAISDADKIIDVGVATSRPLPFAIRIIDELELTSPCIIAGGAQIYDPIKKEIVYEKNMNDNSIKEIFKVINKYNLILLDDGRGTKTDIKENEIIAKTQFWIKVSDQKLINDIISDFSNIPDISVHKVISRFDKDCIEIILNHTEATKLHGIQKVAEFLEINTKDIIGIGDGYNDFPLLMACGLKIAMGNAPDDLKAIADYVAPTVENDGVADVIERFVLNE